MQEKIDVEKVRKEIPPKPKSPNPCQYEDLLRLVLEKGEWKDDRTGTGTISYFGAQMRFDLSKGFPLITTKSVWFKGVAYELLWFLKGSSNIKYLTDNGVHIWDEWADENGDLGPVYGTQWRSWPSEDGPIDQIANAVEEIRRNPNSRRLVVSAWNPAEISQMALPPCHALFQFYVVNGRLSCQLYQRSADMFLGVPFNIASYSLLTTLVAQQCDLRPGEFVWTGGDCHIYLNHIDQVLTQLSRAPYPYPTLAVEKAKDLFSYGYGDFHVSNYEHWGALKGQVAV